MNPLLGGNRLTMRCYPTRATTAAGNRSGLLGFSAPGAKWARPGPAVMHGCGEPGIDAA